MANGAVEATFREGADNRARDAEIGEGLRRHMERLLAAAPWARDRGVGFG